MTEKKIIWITGASSGIGKALAIKFAEKGWTVAASARRESLLQELNKINQSIYSFPLDVTEIENCKLVANKIMTSKNEVRRAINNNGIKVNNILVDDENKIINLPDFQEESMKISHGKKKHYLFKVI